MLQFLAKSLPAHNFDFLKLCYICNIAFTVVAININIGPFSLTFFSDFVFRLNCSIKGYLSNDEYCIGNQPSEVISNDHF